MDKSVPLKGLFAPRTQMVPPGGCHVSVCVISGRTRPRESLGGARPSEPPQRVRPSFKGTTITLKAQKKSSKTSVAVVSKTGRITAKGKSKATITITIGAKTFKCVVTVK